MQQSQPMKTSEVDAFSTRLAHELAAIPERDRRELLMRIGRQELRMRSDGQERPIWKGPAPVTHILGADVVVPTEQGERRGRVVCFGLVNMGCEYERSVVVHVPASGTHHEAPGSATRLASPEESLRIRNEVEMAARLAEASQAAAQASDDPDAVARRKRRGLRDPKLIEQFIAMASASGSVATVEEGTANYKVTGTDPSRRLYVFKTQLRVDVSGFSFDHPGLRRISDQEARDMHLGKVRGQVLFEDRQAAIDAFSKALEGLK
jgi:hypothetical protein